jgi:hypothetical protein
VTGAIVARNGGRDIRRGERRLADEVADLRRRPDEIEP